MARIIELQKGESVPIGKWFQLYAPPFTKDPIEEILFSFKRKFGYYPEKIYVLESKAFYAQHRGKPKRRKEDHEEI